MSDINGPGEAILEQITDVFQTFIFLCKVKFYIGVAGNMNKARIFTWFSYKRREGLWFYVNFFMNIDPSKYLLRLLMDLIQGTSKKTYFCIGCTSY